MYERSFSEKGACQLVAGVEFPSICGLCNPDSCQVAQAAEALRIPETPTLPPTVATSPGLVLELQGNNGRPADSFPLGQCAGDCDSDGDVSCVGLN